MTVRLRAFVAGTTVAAHKPAAANRFADSKVVADTLAEARKTAARNRDTAEDLGRQRPSRQLTSRKVEFPASSFRTFHSIPWTYASRGASPGNALIYSNTPALEWKIAERIF